jgi:MoaA/NifB/PqqE/SkfB family radical SAM enzyme
MSIAAMAVNALRVRRAQREMPLITRARPARVDIEPTTYCNFLCPHCPSAHARQADRATPSPVHLTAADFGRVLDALPTVYRMKLVGLGEPLLNPDFFAMVREASRRRVRVMTTTNGSVLDQERRRHLLDCGLHGVNVSVDAADPATHARLRPGSDLERIAENVAALVRERGRRKRPAIRVWHVVQRAATAELPDLVDRCAEWGVDALLCTARVTNFGVETLEEVVATRRAVAEELGRVLPEARRRAALARLRFRCPPAPPGPRVPGQGRPCRWPWGRAFISARGELRPCPYAAGPEGLTVGPLLSDDGAPVPFDGLWNGEAMQTLREQIRTGCNPAFCRACYPGWTPGKGVNGNHR